MGGGPDLKEKRSMPTGPAPHALSLWQMTVSTLLSSFFSAPPPPPTFPDIYLSALNGCCITLGSGFGDPLDHSLTCSCFERFSLGLTRPCSSAASIAQAGCRPELDRRAEMQSRTFGSLLQPLMAKQPSPAEEQQAQSSGCHCLKFSFL